MANMLVGLLVVASLFLCIVGTGFARQNNYKEAYKYDLGALLIAMTALLMEIIELYL